jgi:hypothetical protein
MFGRFDSSAFYFVKAYDSAKKIINEILNKNCEVSEKEVGALQFAMRILQQRYNDYSEYMRSQIEIDSNKETNSYYYDLSNYILFLSLEDFKKQYEDLMLSHTELKMSDLYDKLRIITSASIDTIKTQYSKKIKDGEAEDNKYNIREIKSGNIRLMYKYLEVSPIDGKRVIMIVGVTYGNTDSNTKSWYISEILSNYELNETTANRIKEMFSGCSSFEELSEEAKAYINDALDYYDYVKSEALKTEGSSIGGNNND